jgi:hypothetical protein
VKPVSRIVAVVAVGTFAVLALAGCIDNSPSKTTGAPTSSASSTSASPTPGSTPTGTPVKLPCTTVLTAQQVYNYNPNYVAQDSYKPAPDTDAASAVTQGGIACGWVDETSGSVLSVAIASPPSSEFTSLYHSAQDEGSAPWANSNATGFFHAQGDIGEFQVFSAPYWIVISSPDFAATGDASPTAIDVLGNLRDR